jgi:integrase
MEQTRNQQFDPELKTRDRAPIRKILELDDPMQAIAELLKQLENSVPQMDHWKQMHRRKLLFFRLISACPLRIGQFAAMTGNHLVKEIPVGGGQPYYQIRFTKDEFKNERFIREQDYRFDLAGELTSFIDEYLDKDWAHINGRPFTKNDRVFDGRGVDVDTNGAPLSKKLLNKRVKFQLMKICKETTARYLGAKYETPGFNPHAMRHIKATAIIKRTGNYEIAALLLWDAIETVRREYSHVKRVDQLAKASREEDERMRYLMSQC